MEKDQRPRHKVFSLGSFHAEMKQNCIFFFFFLSVKLAKHQSASASTLWTQHRETFKWALHIQVKQ